MKGCWGEVARKVYEMRQEQQRQIRERRYFCKFQSTFKAIPSLVWSLCSTLFDPLRNPVLISMTLRVGWAFVFIVFFFRIHITLSDFIIRN